MSNKLKDFKFEIDKKYIQSLLNNCIIIEKNNSIFYINNDNINRQLKFNRLLKNKKEIKIDLSKINFKDNIILEQHLKDRCFYINEKIWKYFNLKYNYNIDVTFKYLNYILCDILNLNKYIISGIFSFPPNITLNEYLQIKKSIIQ